MRSDNGEVIVVGFEFKEVGVYTRERSNLHSGSDGNGDKISVVRDYASRVGGRVGLERDRITATDSKVYDKSVEK